MKTIVYDHQTFALQQYGGISRYFCELASRVNRSDDFRSRVVAPMHFNDHLLECDAPRTGLHVALRHARMGSLHRAANRLLGPTLIEATRPALIHKTYYGATTSSRGRPQVVTVFDMIHELFADHFSPRDTTSDNKRLSVQQADRVLCISKSTASDLIRLFGVPPEKIAVTYLGFSDVFGAPPAAPDSSPHPRPYLLYVGHRGGYKNFNTALRAYAGSRMLREQFDFITFGGFALSDDELSLARSLGLAPSQLHRLTGSDADLARAYRHARVFVYPSLYEGFGIPPLEAMSAQCAVACSNTSSIPEVVGEAAAMFDPLDVDSLRGVIEQVCLDDAVHARLVDAGLQQVRQFSWDRCARDTIAAYRTTLAA